MSTLKNDTSMPLWQKLLTLQVLLKLNLCVEVMAFQSLKYMKFNFVSHQADLNFKAK